MIQQSTLWAIRTGNYPQIAFRKSSMISKWQESFLQLPFAEIQVNDQPAAYRWIDWIVETEAIILSDRQHQGNAIEPGSSESS